MYCRGWDVCAVSSRPPTRSLLLSSTIVEKIQVEFSSSVITVIVIIIPHASVYGSCAIETVAMNENDAEENEKETLLWGSFQLFWSHLHVFDYLSLVGLLRSVYSNRNRS